MAVKPMFSGEVQMAQRGPKPANFSGRRFGRLCVLGEAERRGDQRYWVVACDCGTTKTVRQLHLSAGVVRSCGCLQKETAAEIGRQRATHSMSGAPIYAVYRTMLARCMNPASDQYATYGGRGIKVCGRWVESFESFLADMGHRPSASHSIDRIDPNGHYEASNCRWATAKEQANNTRRTKFLTANGETLPVAIWSEKLGLSSKTIWTRLSRGASDQQALKAVEHSA